MLCNLCWSSSTCFHSVFTNFSYDCSWILAEQERAEQASTLCETSFQSKIAWPDSYAAGLCSNSKYLIASERTPLPVICLGSRRIHNLHVVVVFSAFCLFYFYKHKINQTFLMNSMHSRFIYLPWGVLNIFFDVDFGCPCKNAFEYFFLPWPFLGTFLGMIVYIRLLFAS